MKSDEPNGPGTEVEPGKEVKADKSEKKGAEGGAAAGNASTREE